MKAIEQFFTSVTDSRWFLGNPNLNERSGFTWFIDSSGLNRGNGYWKISVSETGAEFGDFRQSVFLNKGRKSVPAAQPY